MSGDETTGLIAELHQYAKVWEQLNPGESVFSRAAAELERLQHAESALQAQWQAEALNELRAELRLTGLTVSDEDKTPLMAIQRILAARAAALLASTAENGETE
jgi:hypothetical protein